MANKYCIVLYNLIVKLSTAILLLVESESLVCSRKLNLSEIFLVLLVPGFDLKLSEMLEFCRIVNTFQDPRERTALETFQFKGARSTNRK